MTKYKEYLRVKGIKLECDYEFLPCGYVEAVEPRIMDDCVVVVLYSNATTPQCAVYDRYGEHGWFDTDGDSSCIERFNLNSEYVDWLHDVGFSDLAFVYKWLKRLYRNEPKVRIAFKHMKAGVMNEEVFCRWLAKQYKKVLSAYGVC